MPFSKQARSQLSEQFAEIFQDTLEEYRGLLTALRDESVGLHDFSTRVDTLADRLRKLKRIHEQLVSERDELRREGDELLVSRRDERASEGDEPRVTRRDQRSGDGEEPLTA